MLKNLKVGTKLIVILVAPVIVLIGLAWVGAKQRLDAADNASRVGELTSFAAADANLAYQLEIEGLYSAEYMASLKKSGEPELKAQRAKTDAARKEYEDAVKTYDPGRGYPAVQEALKRVDGRLVSLQVNRNSVDAIQTDPTNAIEQYANTIEALLKVNQEIARTITEPSLSRDFQSFVNMQAIGYNRSKEAMYATAVVAVGFYPTQFPTTSSPDATKCTAFDASSCAVYGKLQSAGEDVARADSSYTDNASAAQKQLLRDKLANNQYEELKRQLFDAATTTGANANDLRGGSRKLELAPWMEATTSYLAAIKSAQDELLATTQTQASNLQSTAQREALVYLVFAGGAILIALIIAFYVARATTRPLRELTSAAYSLSTDKLPALVERLRNPEEAEGESLASTLTPIDIHTKDEIGQLADAFNSIQQVTVEVAEEQAQLLRKGIGDIFINLARRNQTLLDRQIEFIDQLEANEEDPDQLDNLFKLDHLATRMRRNAESLLVLAGAEPPRRRGRPVALADVVRVAIGEVEDFARIQLLALDEATVGGNVAVDLAHLLSELMENATHFSPPDTMVEIVGHRSDDGSYILSVSDQGIGMSADQLAEANVQLARPPLVGLALSRSLGFIVIGRLAQRFDISVKLTASPSGGVTALVTLPTDLVTYEGEEAPAAPVEAPAEAYAPPAVEEPIVLADAEPLAEVSPEPDVEPEPEAEPEPVAEPVGASAGDGGDDLLDEVLDEPLEVPEGDEFERGLQSLVSDELPAGPIESDTPGTPPTEPATFPEPDAEPVADAEPEVEPAGITVAEQVAAAARAEAKSAELTAAGLVRRTPKKRSEAAVGGGMPAQAARSTGASQRSPEEVRKMLSRYRSGLNRGRGSADGSETTDS
ncbi:MAG: nitrate- and nitrite sensing domain-containing protein [Acidimicrobiales bacterium]